MTNNSFVAEVNFQYILAKPNLADLQLNKSETRNKYSINLGQLGQLTKKIIQLNSFKMHNNTQQGRGG